MMGPGSPGPGQGYGAAPGYGPAPGQGFGPAPGQGFGPAPGQGFGPGPGQGFGGPGQGPAPRRKGLGCLFVVALLMMFTIGPAAFIVPVVAPQQTCDALAPLVRCNDGSAPDCGTKKSYSGRRNRQSFSITVECEDGSGSSGPVYGVMFGVFGATLIFFIFAMILGVRRRQRG